jgi:hypothetical protein
MNYSEIKQLNPEERKKAILRTLSELTQQRDDLEREIRKLCKLWDETVSELDRRKASDRRDFSEPARATGTRISHR